MKSRNASSYEGSSFHLMNPDQPTLPSDSFWSDNNNRTRRATTNQGMFPSTSSNKQGTSRDFLWPDYPQTTIPRMTQTGTYSVGTSPLPSPPGGTESTTPGLNHPTADPGAYQMMGRYGIPTPSTSSTGTYQWPPSNNPWMCHPFTAAAPRIGRAPWSELAHVLADRTMSPSPPPVELLFYHPLQMTTPARSLTLTPSLTTMSPSRFESAPTSPVTLTPTKTRELPESSSFSKLKERRIPSMSMGPISSGQNLPRLTAKSWELPEPRHGSLDDEMSRTKQQMAFQDHESQWPSTSPSIEGNPSILLTPHPYQSNSQPMPKGRFGILLQGEDYSTFDPEPLTNKAPWSTPSPVSYGRKDHGAPELPFRFPYGYAPQPLPDSPPLRRQGGYRGRGTSHLIVGAGEDQDMGGRGAPMGPPGPSNPTDAERLEQARVLYNHK